MKQKMWLNPAETQKSLFLLGLLPLIQYAELILLLKSHEKVQRLACKLAEEPRRIPLLTGKISLALH
ncbi:MAG: hypothetical protein VXX88_02365, partial [Pseudomonadota bacterium]|nr:hypothetical protein [Pseudomonadota bacterium]